MKTGIVRDLGYLNHTMDPFHPESPERLVSIYAMLEEKDMAGKYFPIEPRLASHDEIARVHNRQYIDLVAGTAGQIHTYLDPDTSTCPDSYETALLAAGGMMNAIDAVMEGAVRNAFAFVRPPGHHAEAGHAAGFCIFNNVAIGACHAMKKYGLKRILIVDWDLHHGNGTQHTFYEDRRVLYFSTHQYPFYPGTGSLNEIGRGEGLGYTINVPLRRGAGDEEFVRIFRKILEPVASAYQPDLVLLSAGFDIYFQDPLGGMKVRPSGFAALTRILMNIADRHCRGRFAATLEGGYHIDGMTQSVKAVLREMKDETCKSETSLAKLEEKADPSIDKIIQAVIHQIRPVWNVFNGS